MSASKRKRAARRRREILRAIEAAPLDATWDRICAWDDVRRRSVWMRVVYREGTAPARDDIERIEIKAGREGSDETLVIDRSNPQIFELYAMFTWMRHVVEMSRDPGPA